jgi:hypothetical protein
MAAPFPQRPEAVDNGDVENIAKSGLKNIVLLDNVSPLTYEVL